MTIVKRGSGFRVVSEKGKNLGDEPSKGAAVKRLQQVEWFKNYAKCIVDPSLVKGNEGMQQYSPIVFQDKKRKDSKGDKLDFPSTTKQLELKDVKQPEFPSTPFTGEAYSQSFHNPRPSNSVKDGTHVIVQGDGPAPQGAGPFRGEHGPDIQFKGSDYVPKKTKKSIMIAGRKVIIRKGSEGSDNENLRNYPIDKDKGEPIDPRNEVQKRKDWLRDRKINEDVRAYDDAKKIHSYTPGNGPFQLAMDSSVAYLGRSKDKDLEKGFGKFMDDKGSMKILSDKEIKAKQKADKKIVAPQPITRKIRVIKDGKSKGIMKFILQYTQNQPLAAGFKPLLAHLVAEEDDDEENLKGPKLAKKAMSSADVYDRISSTRDKNKPISPKLSRLGSRAAKVAEDSSGTQSHDEAAPVYPGVDYKELNKKSESPEEIRVKDWEAVKEKHKKKGTSRFGSAPSSIRDHDYKALNPKSVASLEDYKQHRRNVGTLKEKGPPAQNEPFDALVGSEGGSVDFPHGLDKPAKVLEFKKKEPKSALTDPRDTSMWSGKSEEARPLQLKSPFRNASSDDDKKLAYLKAERMKLDELSGNFSKKQLSLKSSRPNPIEGGKGDDLDYDDVDQKELETGIEVEQEHVKDSDGDEDAKRVKGADIAMDHLAEDEHYYTKLKEMERTSKEGAKAETKKQKLLKLGDVGKSVIKERKLTQTVANAEKMVNIRQQTGASPNEMRATRGQLKAYTAKLKAERKKNESITKALRRNERAPSSDRYKEYQRNEKMRRAGLPPKGHEKEQRIWEASQVSKKTEKSNRYEKHEEAAGRVPSDKPNLIGPKGKLP